MPLYPKDLGWLRDMAAHSGEKVQREDVQTVIRLARQELIAIADTGEWHITDVGKVAVEAMETKTNGEK